MVACLFGASSLPTLHFCCPPTRKFTLSQPLQFTITLSITQPVILTISLLTADYNPHRLLVISPNQIYHFAESTTHKFDTLCIKEPDPSTDKTGSAIAGMENGEISEEEKQKQKDSCRIMVEAATPSASTVLVSDTIYADKDELRICDVSLHSVQNLTETIWVLLNKDVSTVNISIKYTEQYVRQPANVRIYNRLIIFTLPSLETDAEAPTRDAIDQLTVFIVHENHSDEIKLSVNKSVDFPKSDEKVAGNEWLQLRSLFTFASEGDPLALLAPMAGLLSVTDNDGCNALHLAARNKQNFALKTLLTAVRESNDPVGLEKVINAQNVRGQTPLHCAVRAGDADCVHYLVSAGAKKRIMDKGNNMVTHYLGEVYNEAIYKEILETSVTDSSEKNCDANESEELNLLASKNIDGYTPAHIAVRKLKLGLLEAFIEANAPVDSPDNNGETPLVSALQMDDTDMATLLIKNKCNVNVVTNVKETPLWIACRKKNLLLIGRLLDAGADMNIPDKNGKLVKDIEDAEIQKILNGERIQPPEAHIEDNSELPSSSSHSNNDEPTHLSFSYRLHMNADDISSMDYLTRLRLSKLLDTEDKWAKLAEHLGCEHMVEFIRVCADENSSPTMILLDQYEQVPNANLTTVAKCLEEMGEIAGLRLLKPLPTDEP